MAFQLHFVLVVFDRSGHKRRATQRIAAIRTTNEDTDPTLLHHFFLVAREREHLAICAFAVQTDLVVPRIANQNRHSLPTARKRKLLQQLELVHSIAILFVRCRIALSNHHSVLCTQKQLPAQLHSARKKRFFVRRLGAQNRPSVLLDRLDLHVAFPNRTNAIAEKDRAEEVQNVLLLQNAQLVPVIPLLQQGFDRNSFRKRRGEVAVEELDASHTEPEALHVVLGHRACFVR